MKDDIAKAIANILARTGNEWATLDEIYKEVEIIRGEPNANGGASIRRTIGDHCFASEHFKGGDPMFVYRGSNSGQYKLATPNSIAEVEIRRILSTIPKDGPIVEFSDELPAIKEKPTTQSSSRRVGGRPDYVALEIVKSHNGEENERLVFEHEYAEVSRIASDRELQEMRRFFENKNDSEGYDILSFRKTNDGLKQIYIEVKSTTSGEEAPIDISASEVLFAKDHISDWYLYRIFNNGDRKVCKIIAGGILFEKYELEPSAYKIYSK